ncbi:DNA helicase [Tanacetum coccineum]
MVRNMATTSKADSSRQNKGKMIVAEEPEITDVGDLKLTDCNKIIEVIVYRKWTSIHNKTRLPTKFCCMLIDKQGTPIQANMGVEDAEYFDQLLQLHTAYRISGFSYYIGRIRAISGIYTFGDATTQRKHQRTIDIENLSGNIISLALWNEMAINFDMRAYDSLPKPVVIADLNQERTRNRFPLATLLEVNPQNYQRVKFTSTATIYKINSQKEWYYQ